MLKFDAQCCDAHQYINLAQACLAGECYDPVRPAGIQYWFSIPLRVELPLEYVIGANWVLLCISVVLAVLRRARYCVRWINWLTPAQHSLLHSSRSHHTYFSSGRSCMFCWRMHPRA